MKKTFLILSWLCSLIAYVQADDIEITSDLNFEIYDENMADALYEEDIPGVYMGSNYYEADIDFTIEGYLINTSEVERRYLEGEITALERDRIMERAPRWRFSTTLDVMEAITYGDDDDDDDEDYDDLDSTYYNLIQEMIDWYEDNRYEYGLDERVWPTTSYGDDTDRYQFIYGTTVTDIEDVPWTEDIWSDARLLYVEVQEIVEGEINEISGDIDTEAGEELDQFTDLSGSDLEAAELEVEAWDDYEDTVYGSSGDSLPFENTTLEFMNIMGVMDAGLYFQADTLEIGDMIESTRAAQDEDGSAIAIGMADGLYPGFDLGLIFQVAGGVSSVAEDWTTWEMEEDDGEEGQIGLVFEGSAGFRSRGKNWEGSYGFGFEGGCLDFYHPFNSALSIQPRIELTKPMSTSLFEKYYSDGSFNFVADCEINVSAYENEYIDDDEEINIAAASDVEMNYLGIQPQAFVRYKTAGYGGDDSGNLSEDRFTGDSLDSDFDSTKLSNALALEAGLALSLEPLLQRDLEIYYNYEAMLTGDQRNGWNTGFTFNFNEAPLIPENRTGSFMDFLVYDCFTIPFSGGLEFSRYGDNNTEIEADITYYPSEDVQFYVSGTLSNNDYDEQVLGWALGTSVSL
ncbi:MAG: hypothetical protein PQJ59_11595 [Spirochaetales bacterium]|nr:hypothetical protein [Spirochaetales bacterium]